jgi:hypothetical protein
MKRPMDSAPLDQPMTVMSLVDLSDALGFKSIGIMAVDKTR